MTQYDTPRSYVYHCLSTSVASHVRRNHTKNKEAYDGLDALLDGFLVDARVKAMTHVFAARVYQFHETLKCDGDRHLRRHAATVGGWCITFSSLIGAAIGASAASGENLDTTVTYAIAGATGGVIGEACARPMAWLIKKVERASFERTYRPDHDALMEQFLQKLERY